MQVARLLRFIENGRCHRTDRPGGETEARTIETRERSPALQGGVNEEVLRGQIRSKILPAVVS